MRRNVIETVMGAVVLVVAGFFVVFAFTSSGLSTGDGYEVVAEFDDASGVTPGSDVRLSGVKVGTVVGQRLDPQTYFAELTLSIQDDVRLPEDSSARIVPEGLLGSNYVQITPGGAEETIAPGGRITLTQGAVNFADLLGRFIFGSPRQGGEGAMPESGPAPESGPLPDRSQ